MKLKIDGKRFDTSDDAIRYLVREHSKQDLVELMLWSLTNTPEGYVLVNSDMLAEALCATDVDWSVVHLMEEKGVAGDEEKAEHAGRHDKAAAAILAAIQEQS